jgi:hypothetical protein
VEEGSDNDLYHYAGLNTGVVIHGEFDVQIDFSVDEEFHQAPNGKTNAILCVWDESWSESACIEIDSGFYDSHGGSPGHLVKRVFSNDLEGKLRITRTRTHKGRMRESVSGSGSRVVTEQEGDWRTFSFTARRHADGTVEGQWERIRREDGNAADSKSRGIVTCFTIVDNEAWLGGIATHGLYSDRGVAWRVKDNGPGETDTDQISLQITDVGLGYPAWYCARMPDDPELLDIEAGNIQIKQ